MADIYKNINKTFVDFFGYDGATSAINTKYRELVAYGGSGSGKTTSIAMMLLSHFLYSERLCGKPVRMLFTRKWGPALANTLLKDCIDILVDWGAYDKIVHHGTKNYFQFGKSRIDFSSIDRPSKFKGAEYDYIWLEEATDFTWDDYRQLKLRLGRALRNKNAKFIFTFNPEGDHWTWSKLVEQPHPRRSVMHSSYLDNLWNLSDEWIEDLLDLKTEDLNYYNIYALGKPGIKRNIIYTKITQVESTPIPVAYGVDFGFNNPSAVVGIAYEDGKFYLKEYLYERHLTTDDLIQKLRVLPHWFQVPFYCDPSEPDRIEEMQRGGINAISSPRTQVKIGIDAIKPNVLYVDQSSHELIKELKGYKWKEVGGKILDEPVKFNDHLCDALRYALMSHYRDELRTSESGTNVMSFRTFRNRSTNTTQRIGTTKTTIPRL